MSRYGKDDSYNPSSQEYISPERWEYLANNTCPICGLFKVLCKGHPEESEKPK